MRTSRRAALGVATILAAGRREQAQAAAPMSGRQVPGVRRFRVGRFEVTALFDGHLDLGLELFPGLAAGEGAALLRDAFLPASGGVRTPVNAFLVNTGARLYLVDAGTNQGFLPTLAHLPDALAAAGHDVGQVDAVLATHLHPDHVGGASRGGRALFANAELMVPEAEADFWLDPAVAGRAPVEMRALFDIAQEACTPYAAGGRLRRMPAAQREVAPGIEAVALPGHTPGQTGYLVSDSGDALLIWGDVIHAGALQFRRPDLTIAFDTDGMAAVATRRRILDRVAADRLRVAGMHLPFPGVGQVARDGAGYAFVPDPFLPIAP